MNLLSYSLTAVISYLGLFGGLILALIAQEELKEGKKYFIFLQKIILLLIFIFLLVSIKLNYLLVLLILVFVLIYSVKRDFNKLPYIYIILAGVFYLSSQKLNLFVIESSLIFLYGFPTGSLLMKKNKKEVVINILKNSGFILIAIILFLTF